MFREHHLVLQLYNIFEYPKSDPLQRFDLVLLLLSADKILHGSICYVSKLSLFFNNGNNTSGRLSVRG